MNEIMDVIVEMVSKFSDFWMISHRFPQSSFNPLKFTLLRISFFFFSFYEERTVFDGFTLKFK